MNKSLEMNGVVRIICLLAFLTVSGGAVAQTVFRSAGQENDSIRHGLVHKIGFEIRPGCVAPTNSFLEGDNERRKRIDRSLSVHLKYAFQFGEDSYLRRLYPHAYQGIGVSYSTFFASSELGDPMTVYAFQGSRLAALSSRLSLDYEWNFGASFGWQKYNSYSNPQNEVIGSEINAYINLGFMLNWQFHPQWNLTGGVDFTHYSNGNTHYPNGGLNPVGARVGVVHTFGTEPAVAASIRPLAIKPHVSYDLVIYGTTRKKGFATEYETCLVPGSFGVLGLNFAPMYNFNKYFRAGVSVDAQYDESANIKEYKVYESNGGDMKFHRPPFSEQFAVGVSARAELVLPIFSINVGIGRNVICKGDDTTGFYQVLALKTSVTRNLFLHVGYQLSKFKDPNNLMLGFGYRFHNKR